VKKKPAVVLLVLFLLAAPGSFLKAQGLTGTIQGTVTDDSGRPLAGVTVYLSSPSILGIKIFLSGPSGTFDFPSLASGVYKLTAEMPGFRSTVRDQIILDLGKTFFFHFKLTPSELETEVRLEEPLPALDTTSSKKVIILDSTVLHRLPLARSLGDLINLASGVVSPGDLDLQNAAILGGTVRDNAYVLDGANLTDIFTQATAVDLNVDLMEEVEIVSSGQPASLNPAGGSRVRVVSKSGGNSFSGKLGFYFISPGLNQNLWTSSQIKSLNVAPPGGDTNLIEPSLSMGGSFWDDKAWYFLAGRYFKKSRDGIFNGPFQDVEGGLHDNYDWSRKDYSGFLKFTVRPIAEATITAWANLSDVYQPSSEDPSPRLPFLSTHILNHEKSLAFYGSMDYFLNSNTMANVRASYLSRNIPKILQEKALTLPWIDDVGDLYGPLSGADYNSEDKRQRLQADGSLRMFVDDFLGATHTLTAGLSFDDSTMTLNWWRQDNQLRYLDSRDPNFNYYGDRGLMGFWLCGTAQDSTILSGRTQILGAYVTDSFTLARRLTFNLGLRFDLSWGWLPAASKQVSGNPLSLFIGDALVNPDFEASYPGSFPNDYNPWGGVNFTEMKGVLSWAAFSPRAGLAYDLWGNGKTILNASYSRYAETLSQRHLLPLHPLYPRSFDVTWMDANGDGHPDRDDEFSLLNLDYRYLSGPSIKSRVNDGIKPSVTEDVSLGLDHEPFKDFTLGFRVIFRTQKNILEDVLYAPDTGEYWYTLDQASSGKYWIPFTTTVPGTDAYPSETVTLYTRSLQAPKVFLQLRNVPELERKYRALELTFQKRMSHGWQLAGSFVFSKTEGNIGGFSDETRGLTTAADNPNYFLNRFGRLDTDRPLQIRLVGVVELPLGLSLSGVFSYQSGRPWQRWAKVLPPADWCSAVGAERIYYTVNLEGSGSRREKAWSSLDLRLEKEWRVGSSNRLELYADIVNALGFTSSLTGLNDVDRWEPAAEGANKLGQKYLAPDYGITNAVYGRRTIRFGLKLNF